MSDVTQMTDEALVNSVSARHYPDEVQRALAREKSVRVLKDYDAELRAELLRRLRARSVEGLVEAIREHVYYDTPEDHFVDPSIPLVGFEYVEDAILHWGGDTDGH